MIHSLPLFIQLRGRPVIVLGDGEAAAAKRRLLERAGADIRTDENAGASFAIVAIEDASEAEAAVARLRARGVIINAPDRPELCDFTMPAIIDRNPVLIAIGTGGASAGLAKALRQRIEALIPSTLGAMAAAIGKARPLIRDKWPSPADRRRAIDAALSDGAPLDPMSSAGADAVLRWLDGKADMKAPFRLESVPIYSDDPDELTVRAARLLGQADHIFHEASIPPAILNRGRADAARDSIETRPSWNGDGLALWLHRADRKAGR